MSENVINKLSLIKVMNEKLYEFEQVFDVETSNIGENNMIIIPRDTSRNCNMKPKKRYQVTVVLKVKREEEG